MRYLNSHNTPASMIMYHIGWSDMGIEVPIYALITGTMILTLLRFGKHAAYKYQYFWLHEIKT